MGGITAHMLNYIEALKKKNYDAKFTIAVTLQKNEQVLEKFQFTGV